MAVAGVGIGLSFVAATSPGTDAVEQDRAAATGLINTASQLGLPPASPCDLAFADHWFYDTYIDPI
jgi:hypothetical protein